jgi:hypothetical protein
MTENYWSHVKDHDNFVYENSYYREVALEHIKFRAIGKILYPGFRKKEVIKSDPEWLIYLQWVDLISWIIGNILERRTQEF